MIRRTMIAGLLALAAPFSVHAQPRPAAGMVRVAVETAEGTILVDVDTRRAPITAGNFLRYVDEKRLDGTVFYRAAPRKGAPGTGLIQGGPRRDFRRILDPIAHEPTSKTGLSHVDGAISMARTKPGTAMGDFFITVGAMKSADARPGNPGYAAFGRVVKGMDVVRKIMATPTVPGVGSGSMNGQMIAKPVPIISARRVN